MRSLPLSDKNAPSKPGSKHLAGINPVTPHMLVHQVIGGWGATSLLSSEKVSPEENRSRGGVVRQLADFVALNGGGDAIVIIIRTSNQSSRSDRKFAPGTSTHCNLDEFKDVRICPQLSGRC